MSIEDIMASDASGMLSALGEPVTYTPPDGSPVVLDAIIDRNPKVTIRTNAVLWLVEVLKTDLSNPEKDAIMTIGAQEFEVHDGEGARINHDGVWWKIPVIFDERSGFRGRR